MSIAKSIVSYSFIKCEVSEREIHRSGHLFCFEPPIDEILKATMSNVIKSNHVFICDNSLGPWL